MDHPEEDQEPLEVDPLDDDFEPREVDSPDNNKEPREADSPWIFFFFKWSLKKYIFKKNGYVETMEVDTLMNGTELVVGDNLNKMSRQRWPLL